MAGSREFDIVVYGATGYTGRLVCEYLNETYGVGGDVTWAMGGRSQEKLEKIRDELGLDKSVALVVADTGDQSTVDDMVGRTKVLLTTVGPFQTYGSGVVKACVEAGTDYVDLCGEPAWMKDMIEQYDETAKKNSARIVFSCGFDSIPSDIGILLLQETAKEKFGAPFARVKGRVVGMSGSASGGSVASFKATMAAAKEKPEMFGVLVDPFALTEDFAGPEQPGGDKKIFEEEYDRYAAPFVMATINTKNVHRSNFLLGHAYGEDFVYDEMLLLPKRKEGEGKSEGKEKGSADMAFDMSLKPGEGPTKEERESGFYEIWYSGTNADGNFLRVVVKGDRDAGYGSTAKIVSEAAIYLVKNEGKGGCQTPAPAMGTPLVKRLVAHAGVTFDIES